MIYGCYLEGLCYGTKTKIQLSAKNITDLARKIKEHTKRNNLVVTKCVYYAQEN